MILVIVLLAALVVFIIALRAISRARMKPYARAILSILAAVLIFGIAWLVLVVFAEEAEAAALFI